MRLTVRASPPALADAAVELKLKDDISAALRSIKTDGDDFVVNPTVWYRPGKSAATPRVANEAGFLSKTFQNSLLYPASPWSIETTIENQTIDAYAEFQCIVPGATIDLQSLCDWVPQGHCTALEIPARFGKFYGTHVRRSLYSADGLPEELRARAIVAPNPSVLRVGVEFETGNIASSFRALLKLNLLFRLEAIDLGVFVTSNSRNGAATVIWPASNRNGSFDELEQRRWAEVIDVPILGIGFEPDKLDVSAPILRHTGMHKSLASTAQLVKIGKKSYEVWKCPGDRTRWLKLL